MWRERYFYVCPTLHSFTLPAKALCFSYRPRTPLTLLWIYIFTYQTIGHLSLAPQTVFTQSTLISSLELTSRAWYIRLCCLGAVVPKVCDSLCFAILFSKALILLLHLGLSPHQLHHLPGCRFLSSLQLPLSSAGPIMILFFLFSLALFFLFCSTQLSGRFLPLLEV